MNNNYFNSWVRIILIIQIRFQKKKEYEKNCFISNGNGHGNDRLCTRRW